MVCLSRIVIFVGGTGAESGLARFVPEAQVIEIYEDYSLRGNVLIGFVSIQRLLMLEGRLREQARSHI
jgi:hypothetical protein